MKKTTKYIIITLVVLIVLGAAAAALILTSPKDSEGDASSSSTVSGRLSKRRLFASALRLLPSLRAACSCVRSQRVISSRMPVASSTGSRSSRCRFSTRASSMALSLIHI